MENKYTGLEKRKYRRLQNNIFISGNLRSTPSGEFKAFTKDISAGGLMFETDRSIPQDEILDIELYQPVDCLKSVIFSISAKVKVIWAGKIKESSFEGENKYKVGLQFSEIKEEDRQKIVKFVEENKS